MDETIRILIVEDLPTDAELAEREIRKELKSCEFQCVDTREDFLGALENFQPDLIISDYRMPRFDGLTALKLALEYSPLTPVIILTSAMNEDTAVLCMKTGATDYVIKEHLKRLGQAVKHALDEKQLRLERQRAEQALRESEERFRSIYENTTIGLYRTTPAGQILMANPAAVKMLGYDSFEELAQLNIDAEKLNLTPRSEFRRLADRDGVVTGLESIWVKKDGSTIFVRESAKTIYDENGNVVFYDGFFEDITARKQMEEELHLTQFSVDRASIGIMRTGIDARILNVNEKLCQSLGYTKQELCKMHVYDIDPSFPLDEWHKHRKRLQNQGSDVFETTHKRKDGTTFPVEITANYVEYGGSGYSFSFIRDITERKKMMEALQASEASWRARSDELESLFNLAARLRQSQNTNDMVQIILREIQQVVKSDAVAVAFHDKNHQNFRVVGGLGPLAPQIGQVFRDDEGISGVVLRTQTTYITEDYAPDSHRMADPKNLYFANDTGPAACVPLRSENEFLGTIYASRRRGTNSEPFTSEEERLLTAIGEMGGNTLRRARLFEDVQKHLRRTQALHDIQLAVTSSFDLQLTLNVVLEQCLIQLEVDAAAVLIFDPNLSQLKFAAGRGFRTSEIENNRLLSSNSPIYQVAVQRQTVFISNINETSDQFKESLPTGNEDFIAYCGVPLITKGQIKGALEIFHRAQLSEDSEWLSFLETLAGQVAIAIDNLTMFTDLQQSNLQLSLAYDDTIQGLSRALELRDRETKGHSDRVTDLTTRLAQKMGINGVNLIHIRRGAMLHDIGKVGIPDTILLKPGKLTEEEWQVVRQHPQYAYNILSPIKYLQPALDIPYCHHEKWDGTGYPRNLKNEQIPLAARIFAVIDVWDALISERPYRKPWSGEDALTYIRDQTGKHFDPRVVEVFFEIIEGAEIKH